MLYMLFVVDNHVFKRNLLNKTYTRAGINNYRPSGVPRHAPSSPAAHIPSLSFRPFFEIAVVEQFDASTCVEQFK